MALARRKDQNSYFGRITRLKKLFWLYVLLLIFEGTLRKWLVPQLSGPLLIIRDPVGIMIIWEAYRTNKWPERWSAVVSLLTVLLVGLFALQIIAGGNPLIAGLYGLRSFLLPFPVLFIMGENLDEEDLRKFGACTLWLMLPMALLEVGQYVSPSTSFLNKGAYEGGKQIGFVGAHVRASGTFSFAIGVTHFCTLAGAFIFYGMVRTGFAKNWMLWASAFALVLSIPMNGARALVAQLAAVICCVALGAVMGVSQFVKAIRVIVPLVIVAFLVSLLPVFSDAMSNLSERLFTGEGGTVQQSLIIRIFQPAVNAFEGVDSASNWMGIGMGRGAVAVNALLVGTNEAVAGEDEFSRELVEMGPIAGIAFGLFKLFLAIAIFGRAMARARDHEPLALLLLPLAIVTLFIGIPEQPTVQGFMVISMAFCIAATKIQVQTVRHAFPLAFRRQSVLYRPRVQRRRMGHTT